MKIIKRIIQFLKGKNVYLQDFQQKVREIAEKDGKTYFNVNIKIEEFMPNEYSKITTNSVEYSCYIDGYNHFKGKTMNESIERLKEAIDKRNNKESKEIEDIII